MSILEPQRLALLYEHDETAWLEAMAALALSQRHAEMDFPHLSEYLSDMAKRDRREVFSRLVVLLTHLLKIAHQSENQSQSWRGTIREQRRELHQLLESGTLRNHAATIFADCYAEARRQAADETELSLDVFPIDCRWSLDEAIADRTTP